MKKFIALTLAVVFLLLPTASWGAVDPAVMDAYYKDGGSIVWAYNITVNENLCYGAYYHDSRQIRIATYVDDYDMTVAHEIGHWLYHRKFRLWSGELQDMADKAFAESPLRECTDENFAVGYSMYCCRGLGGGLADFYREVELLTLEGSTIADV